MKSKKVVTWLAVGLWNFGEPGCNCPTYQPIYAGRLLGAVDAADADKAKEAFLRKFKRVYKALNVDFDHVDPAAIKMVEAPEGVSTRRVDDNLKSVKWHRDEIRRLQAEQRIFTLPGDHGER